MHALRGSANQTPTIKMLRVKIGSVLVVIVEERSQINATSRVSRNWTFVVWYTPVSRRSPMQLLQAGVKQAFCQGAWSNMATACCQYTLTAHKVARSQVTCTDM